MVALDKLREAVRARRANAPGRTRNGASGVHGINVGHSVNGKGPSHDHAKGFNDDALAALSCKGARNLA